MPKITEGQYALGALTIFSVWVFVALPFLNQTPAVVGGEFWSAKLTDWLLAIFTLFLMVFTARLYYATAGLKTSPISYGRPAKIRWR